MIDCGHTWWRLRAAAARQPPLHSTVHHTLLPQRMLTLASRHAHPSGTHLTHLPADHCHPRRQALLLLRLLLLPAAVILPGEAQQQSHCQVLLRSMQHPVVQRDWPRPRLLSLHSRQQLRGGCVTNAAVSQLSTDCCLVRYHFPASAGERLRLDRWQGERKGGMGGKAAVRSRVAWACMGLHVQPASAPVSCSSPWL